MDNENSHNNSGFQIVSRKRRGKTKRKTKPQLSVNKNELETSKNSDTAGDFPTDDNGSGVEDTEEDKESICKYHNCSELAALIDHNLVSRDAFVYKKPDYESESDANEFETPETSVGNERPVHTEESENVTPALNVRALRKIALTYELEKFEKNALIIFNQVKIDGYKPRLGTEKDVSALTRTFEKFGFEVTPHTDLTKDEIFKELKTFSERDFTDYGCVAVGVLTHGSKKGLLRAKDQQYSENEIINMFKDHNKPTLVTKPKLIFIQACRGDKSKPGVQVLQAQGRVHKDQEEDDYEPYILPIESDWLIFHSSYAGSPSHRNDLHGSWFIQALCRNIETLASSHDLESIITEVKRDVAINEQHLEYDTKSLEMVINKQMPVLTSTLIRKLYLRRFGDEIKEETFMDQLRSPREMTSSHMALDSVNEPVTPLLVQFGPCSCFLDHFVYLRNCLRHFVEENPSDDTAQDFLELADTFNDGIEFNTSKDKMCRAISKHLSNNARSTQYYKYLYFYKNSQ